MQNAIYVHFREVNNRCHVRGIDGKLLDILSQKLNFKFVMIKSTLRAGGEWKAMIEDVSATKYKLNLIHLN